jgi:predicted dehydrogenase
VIRVVALGCGWVTLHRHIPAIRRTPALRLVGVVDRRADRAAEAARRFGVPSTTRLDDPALGDFDAVTIGTAPTAHYANVIEALGASKHVIVEKPFAMSVAEADEMIALASERRRVLAVVHNFQFARSVSAARRIATSGQYGALRGVLGLQLSNDRRRLPVWYRTLPGGLFYDEGPHLLYLVRSFLGEAPIAHTARLAGADPADNTPRVVDVTFSSGPDKVFASLHMNFAAALSEWQLLVLLERATLVCDIFRDILVFLPDDGLHRPWQILGSSLRGTFDHWRGVIASGILFATGRLDYGNGEVFHRFAHAVTTGTAPEGVSGADGRAVVAALHRVLGGAATRFPGPEADATSRASRSGPNASDVPDDAPELR